MLEFFLGALCSRITFGCHVSLSTLLIVTCNVSICVGTRCTILWKDVHPASCSVVSFLTSNVFVQAFWRSFIFAGPVSGAVCHRFGARITAMCGSLLATLGLALSSFSVTVTQLYLTYGILSGKQKILLFFSSLCGKDLSLRPSQTIFFFSIPLNLNTKTLWSSTVYSFFRAHKSLGPYNYARINGARHQHGPIQVTLALSLKT